MEVLDRQDLQHRHLQHPHCLHRSRIHCSGKIIVYIMNLVIGALAKVSPGADIDRKFSPLRRKFPFRL